MDSIIEVAMDSVIEVAMDSVIEVAILDRYGSTFISSSVGP